MSSIEILSIASEIPEQKVNSKDILNKIESKISMKALEMLQAMDIETRYSVVDNLPSYLVHEEQRKLLAGVNELGASSIKKCLEKSPHDYNIGLFIAVTNTAERPLPCMAYEIISMLDEDMMPRDINVINMQNQGCSALIKAFEMASYYLQACPHKQVMICVSETHTAMFPPITSKEMIRTFPEIRELPEYQQQDATNHLNNLINSYLFGDGAVSILLGNNAAATFDFYHLTNIDADDKEILCMNEGGSKMPCYKNYPKYTLGKQVPQRGATYSKLLLNQVIDDSRLSKEDISHYLVHTGSKKIISAVSKNLHLEEQQAKIALSYFILKNYGNLSSCSIGFMLDNLINEKKEHGDVLVISFGVGFSGSVARFGI